MTFKIGFPSFFGSTFRTLYWSKSQNSKFQNGRSWQQKFSQKTAISPKKNPSITQMIIAINILVFIGEINLGGSENIETLYKLGALVPIVVWEGQFWRLITANFLHYGWLHLLMNMMGLYVIGGLVEFLSQRYQYLIIYFASGIGAMFFFSYFAIFTKNFDFILVGASASIMGLLGSLTAIFLQAWWKERSYLKTKRLFFVMVIVGLQFISDLLIPQVSVLSHLFGFIIGFIIALIFGSFVKP